MASIESGLVMSYRLGWHLDRFDMGFGNISGQFWNSFPNLEVLLVYLRISGTYSTLFKVWDLFWLLRWCFY